MSQPSWSDGVGKAAGRYATRSTGLLRLGLAHERDRAAAPSGRFSTPTFDTGLPLISVDDVEAAIEHAEGEDHR